MKIKQFSNGACTMFERTTPSGMYIVQIRKPSGELMDKVRCDDYRNALAYLRSFNAIAKNL